MHPHYGAVPVPHVLVLVENGALITLGILMHLLAAEPSSTVPQDYYSPLSVSCGKILLIMNSMVWDRWAFRAEPMHIY